MATALALLSLFIDSFPIALGFSGSTHLIGDQFRLSVVFRPDPSHTLGAGITDISGNSPFNISRPEKPQSFCWQCSLAWEVGFRQREKSDNIMSILVQ